MLQNLQGTYALLPATRCRRRTHCCSMLPEMTLVEALGAIQLMVNMAPFVRKQLLQNLIVYFFINPVEITSCPFLINKNCLIYEHRFFGCRAYGLWSQDHYEKLDLRSRQAKKHIQEQWENMGISIPQSVIDFQVPYCSFVETDSLVTIDDAMLLNVSDAVESISEEFSRWHHLFVQRYYSDLGFLLASLVFGFPEVVRKKMTVVSDIITNGNKTILEKVVEELPDLCAELI